MTVPIRLNLLMDADIPDSLWDTVAEPDAGTMGLSELDKIVLDAVRAEELGMETVLVGDHLYNWSDAFTTCTAIAAATRTVRIALTVLCNDFRNPVQAAKSIASVDVFSKGRFEYGLGLGYSPDEYRQSGVPFDPPKVRFARLQESAEIIDAVLSSDEPFTFKGDYYTVDGLVGRPRPVQQPRPPMWIGAGGPKMMRLAGQMADRVDVSVLNAFPDGLPRDPRQYTAEVFGKKIDIVREGAGARFEQIRTGTVLYKLEITDDREAAANRLKSEFDTAYRELHGYQDGFPLSVEEILDSPYFWLGTHAEIVDKFCGLRDRFGCTNYTVFTGHLDKLTPVIKTLKEMDGQVR